VFKRAFHLYKELRALIKEMLKETVRNRLMHQLIENLSPEVRAEIDKTMNYLSTFNQEGRVLNQIIQFTNWPTIEFICFHKNWKDIAAFTDI
jgi:hypothetical protein